MPDFENGGANLEFGSADCQALTHEKPVFRSLLVCACGMRWDSTGCGKSSLFCHSERSEESLFDLTP